MKTRVLIINLLFMSVLNAQTTLSQAYEMALSNDAKLLSLKYESQASLDRIKQANALKYPNISLSADYNGEYYKRDRRNIDESLVSYGVNLRQPIYNPAILWEEDQEELRSKISHLAYELEKQELSKKVANAYFMVLHDNQALLLAKSYYETNEAKYNQVSKLLKTGLANKMDMLEAKVRADQSAVDLATAKKKKEISILELQRLTSGNPEVILDINEVDMDFFENINLTKFESLVEKNLELQQSKIKLDISNQEYKKRRSEHLPKLNLQVGYIDSNYLDKDFKDERHKVNINLNFSLPIYQGGYTQARVSEAMLISQAVSKEYENTKNEVIIRIKQAGVDFKRALEQFKITKDAEISAKTYVEAVQRGYDEGLKDIVNLLDSKSRFFAIKRDKLEAIFQVLVSYLEMQSLAGGISVDLMQNLDEVLKSK